MKRHSSFENTDLRSRRRKFHKRYSSARSSQSYGMNARDSIGDAKNVGAPAPSPDFDQEDGYKQHVDDNYQKKDKSLSVALPSDEDQPRIQKQNEGLAILKRDQFVSVGEIVPSSEGNQIEQKTLSKQHVETGEPYKTTPQSHLKEIREENRILDSLIEEKSSKELSYIQEHEVLDIDYIDSERHIDEYVGYDEIRTRSENVAAPMKTTLSNDSYKKLETSFNLRLRYVTWERLFSFLSVIGKRALTAEQYDIVSSAISSIDPNISLPTYKTIKVSYFKNLLDVCFPGNSVIHISGKIYPRAISSDKLILTCNSGRKDPRDCIRVAFPSQWAKADVLTFPFYEDIFNNCDQERADFLTIERSPIALHRYKAFGYGPSVWVEHEGAIFPSELGSCVNIPCAGLPRGPGGNILELPGWKINSLVGKTGAFVEAITIFSWYVNESPLIVERTDPSYEERKSKQKSQLTFLEKKVVELLSNCTHKLSALPEDIQHNVVHSDSDQEENFNEIEYGYRRKNTAASGANSSARIHNNTAKATSSTRNNTHISRRRSKRKPNSTMRSSKSLSHVRYNPRDVLPGDICVIIRPYPERNHVQTELVGVFIASFMTHGKGFPAERIVWLESMTKNGPTTELDCSAEDVLFAAQATVTGVFKYNDIHNSPPSIERETAGNIGVLSTGEDYVVYRFALYADGFKQKKSLSDTKSVGGIYMLPLGFSNRCRKSSSSIRLISIVPNGHSINDALSHVTEDIINGTIFGISGFTPSGKPVRIFLDCVAFFGDYPAASSVTDVLGHTASSFCTLCNITRRKGTIDSETVYTSHVHSRRLSSSRFDSRSDIIRAENMESELLRRMGMKHSEKSANLPCLSLSARLREKRHLVPTSKCGFPVVSALFDSTSSVVALPDHLFSGIAKNILTLCMKEISDDSEKRRVESLIIGGLSSNGLPVPGNILRWDSNKKYLGLQNLTMTQTYCILLVCSVIFSNHNQFNLHLADLDSKKIFGLPQKLQSVVSKTFWWPSLDLDGPEKVSELKGGMTSKYCSSLQILADQYVDDVNNIIRNRRDNAKIIDKPNAHRLLELVRHTIPLFGHGRLVTEMILEQFHRRFKDWLETNTHYTSHISACERALSRDWSGRICILQWFFKNGTEEQKKKANIGLRRFFLGSESLGLNENENKFQRIWIELENQISSIFAAPIPKLLSSGDQVNTAWTGSRRKWEGCGRKTRLMEYNGGQLWLNDVNLLLSDGGIRESNLRVFEYARYVDKLDFGWPKRAYKFHTLRRGNCLSVFSHKKTWSDSGGILNILSCEDGSIQYYTVFGILGEDNEKLFAVIRRMTPIKEDSIYQISPMENTYKLLPLDFRVRRVATFHLCNNDCLEDDICQKHMPCNDATSGEPFFLLDRERGFPPHMA